MILKVQMTVTFIVQQQNVSECGSLYESRTSRLMQGLKKKKKKY